MAAVRPAARRLNLRKDLPTLSRKLAGMRGPHDAQPQPFYLNGKFIQARFAQRKR